jgi:hypothetical protein
VTDTLSAIGRGRQIRGGDPELKRACRKTAVETLSRFGPNTEPTVGKLAPADRRQWRAGLSDLFSSGQW